MAVDTVTIKFETKTEQLEKAKNAVQAVSDTLKSFSGQVGGTGKNIRGYIDELSDAVVVSSKVVSVLESLTDMLGKEAAPAKVVLQLIGMAGKTISENKEAIQAASEATKKATREIIDSLYERNKISKQQYVDYLKTLKAVAESEAKLAESRKKDLEKLPVATGIAKHLDPKMQFQLSFLKYFGTQFLRSDEKEVAKLGQKKTEDYRAITQLSGLIEKFEKELAEEDQKQKKARQEQESVLGRSSSPEKLSTADPQSLFGGGIALGKATPVATSSKPQEPLQEAKQSFVDLMGLQQSFQNSFDAGMMQVGQSINQSLGGAFRRTFGEANSMLEVIVQTFLCLTITLGCILNLFFRRSFRNGYVERRTSHNRS